VILKKPYKILIKNFRIIHLILAIMSAYLIYKTNSLVSFFNEYMSSSDTVIGTDVTGNLFSSLMFILPFITLLGITVIVLLMKWKDKPIILYLINILIYLAVLIVYTYVKSVTETMELELVDIRTLKLVSDSLFAIFFVQTLSIITFVIRAIGFDIEKFDFGKDLDLDISEKDNEEFEFEVKVDTGKIRRNIIRNSRNFKYIYKENRFLINIFIGVGLLFTGFIVYLNVGVYNKIYKENKMFSTNEFSMKIENSYITDSDYQGNKIVNNKLVVVKIKIKNNSNDDLKLETARLSLKIGNISFHNKTKYKSKLIDLGNTYTKEEISKDNFQEYLLVFEVPKNYSSKKMILSYEDKNDKKIRVKLSPYVFKDTKVVKNYKIGESINFKNSIIKNTSLKIYGYETAYRFKNNYDFCLSKTECISSYEYLVASLTGNKTKALLKLKSDITLDKDKYSNKLDSTYKLISTFGTITYKVGNETKTMRLDNNEVIPTENRKDNETFIEIYGEIMSSSSIVLNLNVRDKQYNYTLK